MALHTEIDEQSELNIPKNTVSSAPKHTVSSEVSAFDIIS